MKFIKWAIRAPFLAALLVIALILSPILLVILFVEWCKKHLNKFWEWLWEDV